MFPIRTTHLRSRFCLAAAGLALAVAAQAASAPAAVTVQYVHPESFTDVGDGFRGGPEARRAFLEALDRHLKQRAGGALDAGQTLRVEISDVDMAGEFESWRIAGADVRIIRDVYPARIDLNFRLADASGAMLKQGERRLRDTGLVRDVSRYSNDPLRYEKALIDAWVEREFPAAR